MMRHLIAVLLAVTVVRPQPAGASQFVDSGAAFPAAAYATTAFGDYDLDGDLDLLLTGLQGPNSFSRIYRNDGVLGWTDIGAAFIAVRSGAGAWGDYDGDGDLDLLLTGLANSSAVSRIYRNDSGGFTDTGAALSGVHQSSAAWADIDNDGDLDAVLLGATLDGGGSITRIYRNDDAQFIEIDPPAIPDLHRGSIDFGDGDGDGDLDLLVTGLIDFSTTHSRIYRNDGGQFTELQAGLKNLYDGAGRWGDYDLDGDLDVLENGSDSTATQVFTKLYRNDGNNVFTPVSVAIAGAGEGAALAWGDYDTDGDSDFAAMAVGFNRTEVFRNDGGLSFPDAGENLANGCCGSLAWGDVDADGDLDFIVGGVAAGPTKLYRNEELVANTEPSAPTGLMATPGAGAVTLRWSPAEDLETPSPGLTYNLRVGTSPGGSEVMPGMADAATGRRRIPASGNVSLGLSCPLRGLSPGTYFWSVQAIDPAFEGSAFAPEATFVINETAPIDGGGMIPLGGLWLAVEAAGADGVLLRYSVPDAIPFIVSAVDAGGRWVGTIAAGTGPVDQTAYRWQPSDLASGIYFIELESGGRAVVSRLVWIK